MLVDAAAFPKFKMNGDDVGKIANSRRNIILCVGILSLGLGGLLLTDRIQKQKNGYCFDEGRYLEEEELRSKVVAHFLQTQDDFIGKITTVPKSQIVSYLDQDHFYELNPDCCPQIKRSGYDFTYDGDPAMRDWKRRFGDAFYLSSLKVAYLYMENSVPEKLDYEFAITVCG